MATLKIPCSSNTTQAVLKLNFSIFLLRNGNAEGTEFNQEDTEANQTVLAWK